MVAGSILKMKIVGRICCEPYLAPFNFLLYFKHFLIATFFVVTSVNWKSNHIPYDLRLLEWVVVLFHIIWFENSVLESPHYYGAEWHFPLWLKTETLWSKSVIVFECKSSKTSILPTILWWKPPKPMTPVIMKWEKYELVSFWRCLLTSLINPLANQQLLHLKKNPSIIVELHDSLFLPLFHVWTSLNVVQTDL
jgi:hypothetical protein